MLAKRDDLYLKAGIFTIRSAVWVNRFLVMLRDGGHRGLRRLDGNRRPQAGDHPECGPSWIIGDRKRSPHIHAAGSQAELELGRHNTHNSIAAIVQPNGPANDAAIAAIPAHEQGITQDCHHFVSWLVLFRCETPAQNRRSAENGKQAGAGSHRSHPFGVGVAREIAVLRCERGRRVEDPVLRTILLETLGIDRQPVDTELEELVPYHHQPSGILVRQRAQQHRVHHTEDRGIGANSERERQHGGERESGSSGETSERVADVLEHGVLDTCHVRRVPAISAERHEIMRIAVAAKPSNIFACVSVSFFPRNAFTLVRKAPS